MATIEVRITCERSPELVRAIASLEELAKRSPERVQRFLDCPLCLSELIRVDGNHLAASGAGDLRVLLEPSYRFLDFLAASGTSKRDDA